jgi:N-acetylneuraminic acid mutarotase
MRIILSLYVLQIVLCNNIYSQNSWKRLADFPTIRYLAVSFSIGNKGYAGTGIAPDSMENDLWEYNPDNDTWIQMARMPAPRRNGGIGFSINQKGYIGGGTTDSSLPFNNFWEYDPVANKWTQKADIPVDFVVSGSLVVFSIEGKGYVKASFVDTNFWAYDQVSDSWTKRSNFPGIGKLNEVGFAIGLKGYIGTGFADDDNTSEFWEYDPSEDKWIQRADFPGDPRNGAVGFSIGNYGYIGLGNSGGDFPKDFWRYDPSNNTWSQIDSCGYGADGAFAFSIGNKGYVGTGVFIDVGEFWEYDSGITSVQNYNDSKVNNFNLYQNYPNPFNPTTTISYYLPNLVLTILKIYDVLGREIATLVNEEKPAGEYEIKFKANDLSNGIYFYQLKAGTFIETKKMILMK